MKETKFDELVKGYEPQFKENLKKFVAINSVDTGLDNSLENPFGQGVTEALNFFENLAKEDGFKATNYSNKVVELLVGEGSKNITIMAHADIVPAGTGWEHDPFDVVEKDGVLYGRGVADDKGPLLSCYYALKALRDNNLLGNYQVRFLVGGNEEKGSRCMQYYFDELEKEQPTLGFSPDSSFPLIFAEKGMAGFVAKGKLDLPGIFKMHGGSVRNAVIEKFEVEMIKDEAFIEYLNQFGDKVEIICDDSTSRMKLIFKGVGAHGSIPWEGFNAGLFAIKTIADFYDYSKLRKFYDCLYPTRGEGLKVNSHSEDMGDNSCNVGILTYDCGVIHASVDFRYVNTITYEEIVNKVKENIKPFRAEFTPNVPILHFDKDSTLVSTLLNIYKEETGDVDAEPISCGGGTYAKEANNVVAFGPGFADWDCKEHCVGEQMRVKDLMKAMAIYAHAIIELGNKL